MSIVETSYRKSYPVVKGKTGSAGTNNWCMRSMESSTNTTPGCQITEILGGYQRNVLFIAAKECWKFIKPEVNERLRSRHFRELESSCRGSIIRVNHIRPILPQRGSLPRSIIRDDKIHCPGKLKSRPQRNRLST